MERFQGRLVFKAHGLVFHSTLGLREIKKKKKKKRVIKKKRGAPVAVHVVERVRELEDLCARIWHPQDSHGHILALTAR